MKRFAMLLTAVCFAILGGAGSAAALSVGFYGSAGGGISDWESGGTPGLSVGRDTRHGGYGVVLGTDTFLAPFAYRLGLGYERIDHEGGPGHPGATLRGFVVDQDLTIDLVGQGPLRIWAGPEMRLGFFRTDGDTVGGNEDFFALGLGPVLGFDFAIGPGLDLSWKIGYLVTGFSGDDRSSFRRGDADQIGEGHAYVSLALMFRTWNPPREREPERGRHRPW